MKTTRKIVAAVFWAVALASVVLVIVDAVPQIRDILAADADNEEAWSSIQLAEAVTATLTDLAVWLVLAGVSVGNVTLLRMLDAIEEL